jgi:hypothetical protein
MFVCLFFNENIYIASSLIRVILNSFQFIFHALFENTIGSAFLLYIVYSCAACGVAACIVAFIEPFASGAGVPEINALLNG